ncbi:MAG: peptidase M14 family protein [Mariniphaga sp.]|nr:peptidase M14 family protein [Mariniphaga sp.]
MKFRFELSPFFSRALFSVFILSLSFSVYSQEITSPEKYFGFQMGADRKLARWDKIVDYFYLLEKESDKLQVINMGPSSDGHPFLLTIISSPENLANLDKLQEINKTLTDPRGISEETIKEYIQDGKVVIFQSMSLHASEVGGTQMTPELSYDLLTREDDETKRILDNVLFFMVPSLNPDGQVMITDWYRETVGTEYEGLSMPYLYHKYCGHDNNRDGDYFNLQESKYMAKAMFVDWPAQAYIDHHHMGSYGARFYVPPYCDPIRPYADPLVWREMSWYGAHIAYKLEEKGFQGILNAAQFSGWGHFGWHWITPFHNIAGMLTESAGVNLASPIYVHPEQLRANARMFPEYEAQSTFPNPWPGGWWRLRNIVEQKKSSAWSLLDLAARNKETVLTTAYIKAKNQTERGTTGKVKTIIIPASQHDYLTLVKMVNILLQSGIEIQKANSDFEVNGMNYKKGSYIISLAQPKMGLIMNLLTETHYADNSWTREENGTPIRPYDLATHTMFEFMGINVDVKNEIVKGDFSILKEQENIIGKINKGDHGYILDGRQNASYKAVNLLTDCGIKIKRLDTSLGSHHPGDFIIDGGSVEKINSIAKSTGVSFNALSESPSINTHLVKRGRTGLFQRYYGGNMDEGWTRLCFENYSFPYSTLMSEEIKEGNLNKKYDVIVIPDDSKEMITGDFNKENQERANEYPEKYRSGIGEKGTEAIIKFVENGGTLVALGDSYEFAVETFGLKVRNPVEGLGRNELFCPGSTVKVNIDNSHPLAYGMPDEGLVLYRSSPVFEVVASRKNADYKTIVRYKNKGLLKSGWLIGEKNIAKKSAMLTTSYGKGKIVLIGFRTQHRNQTDATFKLLFNSIIE